MVGCGDDHRVDLLVHFVEHLAEVRILPDAGESLISCGRTLLVDIAERDDVLGLCHDLEIAGAATATADHGDVQLLVGRPVVGQPSTTSGRPNADARQGRVPK